MSAKFHQISLKETFSECQDLFTDDAPSFFQLLDEHLDLESFIPDSFFNAFYRSLGRKRLYPLSGFLAALILQKILSIPTDSLLILFLNLCKELRDFCGFHKVPDAPLFTRFKQDFLPFIEEMFHQLVDFTEPICLAIDSSLAQMLTFDTSGIELYVTENNPKTLNALIRRLKAYYKDNPERVLYNDQDLLNGLLHEHRVLVDMKWNVQEGAYRVPKGKTADWCPPYIDTILHPAILHYSSRKPWQYHCMHPLRHLYFEYQDLTPWKGENVLNNWKPRLHRFIHFLPYTLGLKRSKYLNLFY